MEYHYTALNHTETLEHDNNHLIVNIQLHGENVSVTINAIIDSGAQKTSFTAKSATNTGSR